MTGRSCSAGDPVPGPGGARLRARTSRTRGEAPASAALRITAGGLRAARLARVSGLVRDAGQWPARFDTFEVRRLRAGVDGQCAGHPVRSHGGSRRTSNGTPVKDAYAELRRKGYRFGSDSSSRRAAVITAPRLATWTSSNGPVLDRNSRPGGIIGAALHGRSRASIRLRRGRLRRRQQRGGPALGVDRGRPAGMGAVARPGLRRLRQRRPAARKSRAIPRTVSKAGSRPAIASSRTCTCRAAARVSAATSSGALGPGSSRPRHCACVTSDRNRASIWTICRPSSASVRV